MHRDSKQKTLLFFIIGYVAYTMVYLVRLNFSVASVLLQDAHILTKGQVGIIGSIFALTYAAVKIPGGYLGDRVAPKWLVAGGLFLAGISNFLIGLHPSFPMLAAFWLLNAMGQGLIWGPLLRALSEYYGTERSKTLNPYFVSSTATGSVLGLLLSGFISDGLGAKGAFILPGIATMLVAVAVLLYMNQVTGPKARKTAGSLTREIAGKAEASGSEGPIPAESGERDPGAQKKLSPKELLTDKFFLLMILPAIGHGLIKDNLNVWLGSFFADKYAIDIKAVSLYIFFVPVMALIGRFLYPPLAKLFKQNHLKVSTVGFIACVVLLIPLLIPGIPAVAAVLCLGLLSAMVSLINSYILSLFPMRYAEKNGVAMVASLMDTLTYGGAGLGSLFFGFLIGKFGYNSMFFIWMAASVISALVLIYLNRISSGKQKENL